MGTGIEGLKGPRRHMLGLGQAIPELSRISTLKGQWVSQICYFVISRTGKGFIPIGACWKEKAMVFFTRSMGTVNESLGKPSLMIILIRPTSSAGLQ